MPKAQASEQLIFENGGTATLTDQGTIEGTCQLEVVWHGQYQTFIITMPDGQVVNGHCIDFSFVGPANDSYEFTATPNLDGSYQVLIHSDRAAYYATPEDPRTPAEGADIQRVELDDNWKPKYRKPKASLTLRKSSDGPSGGLSLAGAKYAVWRDADCTISAGPNTQLTTNEDGTANTVTLEPGTYWVREFEAPAGFKIDIVAHEVNVVDDTVFELSVSDTPDRKYPEVLITKTDAQYKEEANQTGALAGAEFTMRYYDDYYTEETLPEQATRTWILRSDETGVIKPTTDFLVGSDGFYTDGEKAYFPLGTYTVQETKAPAGYWLEGETPDSDTDYKAPIHLIRLDSQSDYEAPTIQDSLKRAGISLQKRDAETGVAQGNATLKGITFTLKSKNEQAVLVDGKSYKKDEVIRTFVTDELGQFSTSNDYLPLGTYELEETGTNESMLLDSTPKSITLDEAAAGKVISLSPAFSDKVIRGGIRVGKTSHELNAQLAQGGGSLGGAQISIVNESQNPVLVNNVEYDVGEVVCTLTTDDSGFCQTDSDALPFGTYLLTETKAPVGYLLNKEWSKEIQIRENGKVYGAFDENNPNGEQYLVDDQVIRGGFHFVKVDEDSMSRMPYTVFRITSTTTGESHIIVADDNGVVSTEKATHTAHTNENDEAVDANGNVDESRLDPTKGIWFWGTKEENKHDAAVSDDLCALPYDTYRIDELASSINTNKKLVSFLVKVQEHAVDIDMGTVTNKNIAQPNIKTSLTYDGCGHLAPVAEHIVLVDEVSYEGLVAGQEYTLRGELCFVPDSEAEKEDGTEAEHVYVCKSDGTQITAELLFTPTTSSGVEKLSFELDSSVLAGKSVVALEHLIFQDHEVATHDDVNDASQTVTFPSLETTFTDGEGNHEVSASGEITVSDTVRYENLDTTQNYEVTGTLMDASTERPVLDENGIPVRGSTTFMPAESSGSVQVDFTLDTNQVSGKDIVAFEKLNYGGVTMVTHEDISNLDQTITVAGLQTTLTDAEGHHVIMPKETIELIDSVRYTSLVVGDSYTITGTLVDRETGEPILDDMGTPLTSSTSFEAKESSGTIEVKFSCAGTLLEGRIAVAFEELVHEGRVIASHANINDEAQTVYLPSIGTTFTTVEHSHSCPAQAGMTLNDLVTYKGLCAGLTYTLIGTVMDYETKQPVTDGNGQVLRVSQEFVPNDTAGTVELGFVLDTSNLAGHKLVAFETLYEGDSSSNRVIATHEDWEDDNQTVSVEAPKLTTTQKETIKQASSTVSESKSTAKEKTPNTGDTIHAPVLTLLIATTFLGMGLILRYKRLSHKKNAPRHMR